MTSQTFMFTYREAVFWIVLAMAVIDFFLLARAYYGNEMPEFLTSLFRGLVIGSEFFFLGYWLIKRKLVQLERAFIKSNGF